jgi:hypothetical protein
MNRTFTQVRAQILADPERREEPYQEQRRLQAARAERDPAEEAKFTSRLYRRTQYTPPGERKPADLLSMNVAEAWVFEHPGEEPECAATYGEMQWLSYLERLRLKAVRERLKEMGIKG